MKHLFLYIAAVLAASTAADKTVTLPDAFGAPAGAVALAPPEYYTSNGLYEYLDGGADIYIESGMKTCAVRRYGDPKNKNADYEVAVYDMELPVIRVRSVQAVAGKPCARHRDRIGRAAPADFFLEIVAVRGGARQIVKARRRFHARVSGESRFAPHAGRYAHAR